MAEGHQPKSSLLLSPLCSLDCEFQENWHWVVLLLFVVYLVGTPGTQQILHKCSLGKENEQLPCPREANVQWFLFILEVQNWEEELKLKTLLLFKKCEPDLRGPHIEASIQVSIFQASFSTSSVQHQTLCLHYVRGICGEEGGKRKDRKFEQGEPSAMLQKDLGGSSWFFHLAGCT